jgi:hypothetical protein
MGGTHHYPVLHKKDQAEFSGDTLFMYWKNTGRILEEYWKSTGRVLEEYRM